MKDYTQKRLEELKGWMENVLEHDVEREYIKSFLTNSIAQAEQEMLKRVVGLYGTPNCDNLHHSKKQQHTGSEICPVVREIEDRLSSLDKEINNK